MSSFLRFSVALHLSGLAALPLMPRRWPWVVGAFVLNHLALAGAGLAPRSRLLGPNLHRLNDTAPADAVALTFDDGPDPEVTPRVLDLLAERGATATFFCIGRRAAAHPEIVREIVRGGHRVENHTYTHPNSFAFYGPAAIGRELDRAQDVLERESERRPVFFRAPAGVRSPLLQATLLPRDIQLVSWTRRSFDTVDSQPRRVTRRLTRGLRAGEVLLLHDGSAAHDASGRPVVLEALPRLLDHLADNGLRGIALPSAGLC